MPGELDMRRMQEEAARRAREMQARARNPQPRRPQGEQRQRQEPPKEPAAPEPQSTPPPAVPQAQPEPVLSESGQGQAGLLGSLFQDKERTIILALLILLGSEEGSQELMFALLFLLM